MFRVNDFIVFTEEDLKEVKEVKSFPALEGEWKDAIGPIPAANYAFKKAEELKVLFESEFWKKAHKGNVEKYFRR